MQSDDLRCTPLGVVLTNEGKEPLDEFKLTISSSLLSQQSRFLFATCDGHYIREKLSRVLTVADIMEDGTIYITKQHDPSRDPPTLFGVVAQPGDLPMGYFTCSSINALLSTARMAILEQVAHKETLEKLGFLFLYEKYWPISFDQESTLALFDILDRKQVFIQFKLTPPTQSAIPVSLSEAPSKPTAASLAAASLASAHKRVYLSYVCDETSAHADALQAALKKLGFKVYTEQGNQVNCESSSSESSEQEYSNKFIQKAAVFIPIVSSRYGETSITNLEVKYADSLEKFIIPLNLNLHWPPNCLAIQFASVNFIRWKTKEPIEKEASSMAEGIVEVMQMNQDALNTKPSKVVSKRKSSVALSDEKSLVVIICHSAQASFLEHVKGVLEKKSYMVWSSLELEDSGVHISNSVFQKKARDCCLVICIISKRFCSSMSCEQLVYYCQHRKKMIPVMYEDVEMPYWVSMLVGSEDFIDGRGHTFDDLLCKSIKLALSSSNVSTSRREEREIKRLQQELFSRLPDGNYVYFSGGSHFYSTNGEAICKLLGKELAKLKSVVLVTGGFFGIGDTVAKSFYDRRKKLGLPINLYHTMATKDPADRSRQTRQREDGTMELSPYGETIFLGNSVRQCGTVSTRVFNICILIEGGPSAAYEVQQFTWNGAVVIPIKSTGGAAGGKFLVPSSIYHAPLRVSESDWSILSNDTASVEDIVASLVRIVEICFQIGDSKKAPSKTK